MKITIAAFSLIAALSLFSGFYFFKYETQLKQAENLFSVGDYKKTLELTLETENSSYAKILQKTKFPYLYTSQFGRLLQVKALTLYNLGEIAYAKKIYLMIIDDFRENPLFLATAKYNLGRIFQEQEDFANAAAEYIEVLKINPFDRDAKINLEYLMVLREKVEAAGAKDKEKKQKKELSLKDLMTDFWKKRRDQTEDKKLMPRW